MKARIACVCLLAAGLIATTRAQLTFNLTYDPGINPEALTGFQTAAARWSALFSDPITINLQIGFNDSLGSGILGQTNPVFYDVGYSTFTAALTADRTSVNDYTAVASLQSGPSYSLLLNHPLVPDSTYSGSGNVLSLTQANAHALGLGLDGVGSDGSITFNSTFNFDFDPNDGIAPGEYDFVGVATHEIGHVLGFYSGVDFLVLNPTLDADHTIQNSLDLFRYSAPGVMDGTADVRPKYFSIDGGTTDLGEFSTGRTYGDGHQASHWKDGQNLGIMDPTSATGELLAISALDVEAFDVIGYNLASVPEPAGFALAVALLAGGFVAWRRWTAGRLGGGL